MDDRDNSLHVGIIPDGSRRWGRRTGKPPWWDGWEAGEKVEEVLWHICDFYPQVTELTIWAMSTENFERRIEDRQRVFNLIERLLSKSDSFKRAEAQVKFIGTKLHEIPASLHSAIKNTMEYTNDFVRMRLNIALGYGGNEEIFSASVRLAQQLHSQDTLPTISRTMFERFLMISRPVDLIIRTGGEKRLSGFLPYQAEYAELFFVDSLWPDFTVKEFDQVMEGFCRRERRFGR